MMMDVLMNFLHVQYDRYRASEKSIYALYMFESQNNTMIGSYRPISSDELIIFTFDGSCGFDYSYDADLNKRDSSDIIWESCPNDPYDPLIRPWYELAQQLNEGSLGWTEPYIFIENDEIGMSLVRKIDYNGIEVIFFTQFTIIRRNI